MVALFFPSLNLLCVAKEIHYLSTLSINCNKMENKIYHTVGTILRYTTLSEQFQNKHKKGVVVKLV